MAANRKDSFMDWFKAGVIAFVLFLFIRIFFFSSYEVEGESMQPTLQDGNRLVVNKIGYQIQDIHRFDVIVFHANDRDDYVKRVIGLPGDKITYKDDWLYVNGVKYQEPYLQQFKHPFPGLNLTGDFTLNELTNSENVPNGKLFVMGDNRLGSMDSRHFGYVSIDKVVGKVDVRYWPLDKFNINFRGN
ncbi:signal peptidase I [Peribacillus cavernae]|uniref:Signal peptidase I n=1 Tax=Peribacillus cavernae TaxID=1674310 RepID=A0A3S0U4P9_9BACI|nr:signal peptidase I [Peribacillus cavernae]MDQ0217577.1 signal peptidase I [Peribacillus cavernae]RUQ29989.1 signal peptidase I [Peribacillus cavernae]